MFFMRKISMLEQDHETTNKRFKMYHEKLTLKLD
jgi:hypothetical protein